MSKEKGKVYNLLSLKYLQYNQFFARRFLPITFNLAPDFQILGIVYFLVDLIAFSTQANILKYTYN